jgi:hypothetical protein
MVTVGSDGKVDPMGCLSVLGMISGPAAVSAGTPGRTAVPEEGDGKLRESRPKAWPYGSGNIRPPPTFGTT